MQFGDIEQVRISGNTLDFNSRGICPEYRLGQNGRERSVFVVSLITSVYIF